MGARKSTGSSPRRRKAAKRRTAAAEEMSGNPGVDGEPREQDTDGELLEQAAGGEAPELEDHEDAVEVEILEPEIVDAEVEPDIADAEGEPDVIDLGADLESGEAAPKPAGAAPVAKKGAAAATSSALVPTDALSLYLAEIRQYSVLSREEEHELALRYYEQDDAEAGVQLVTSNLRLVVMVAREYQRAFHNLLDLVQEGNVGLLEAVKQFDPYRGVRFPSYAVWWVRAYIIRYVMNNFRLVKVGTTQAQRRLFFNLKKEKARLEAKGFTPTAKAIAEKLGVKEKEVIEMDQRLASSSEVSADAPLGEDRSATVMDLIPAPDETAEEQVAHGEFYALMKEKLEEFGATLEGRAAEIFSERLLAESPLTLQELGDRYGVSRERVRQMEAALKKKLREYLVEQVRDIEQVTL